MFNHILVPLDGSDTSESALPPAASLAAKYGSSVTLMSVMLRFPESRIHVPKLDAQSLDRGKAYVEEVRGRAWDASIPADLVVRLGIPADEIVDYAREAGVDIIVMSTHGTTGTDRVRHTIGSTAWKILHAAPCPILLVPLATP